MARLWACLECRLNAGTLSCARRFAYFLGTIIEVFFITEEPLISEYETPQDAFDESKRRARNISLYFLALAVGFFLMASLQGHMFAIVGSRLSYRVRQLFIDAVLHMVRAPGRHWHVEMVLAPTSTACLFKPLTPAPERLRRDCRRWAGSTRTRTQAAA